MSEIIQAFIFLILWWSFYCLITVLEEIRDAILEKEKE